MASKTHGRNGGHLVYTCREGACFMQRREWVDTYVERLVVGRLDLPDALEELLADEDDSEDLREEAVALRSRLDVLATSFADGLIDREQLAAGSERIRAQLESVERQMAKTGRVAVLSGLRSGQAWAWWSELPLPRRRAVLGELVAVEIAPAGRGARSFRPETVVVDWKG